MLPLVNLWMSSWLVRIELWHCTNVHRLLFKQRRADRPRLSVRQTQHSLPPSRFIVMLMLRWHCLWALAGLLRAHCTARGWSPVFPHKNGLNYWHQKASPRRTPAPPLHPASVRTVASWMESFVPRQREFRRKAEEQRGLHGWGMGSTGLDLYGWQAGMRRGSHKFSRGSLGSGDGASEVCLSEVFKCIGAKLRYILGQMYKPAIPYRKYLFIN